MLLLRTVQYHYYVTLYNQYQYQCHRKNLILTNVTEERLIDPSDYRYRQDGDDIDADAHVDAKNDDDGKPAIDDSGSRLKKVERHISQAMIPGSRLFKVEIAKSLL